MNKLNCKPGDLAVIVASVYQQNNGAIVEVVRPYADDEVLPGHVAPYISRPVVVWVVRARSRLLVDSAHPLGIEWHAARDSVMRPITPPAGTVTDEEVRELYEPRKTREPA